MSILNVFIERLEQLASRLKHKVKDDLHRIFIWELSLEDVQKALAEAAEGKDEKLDWQTSVVDLMKLCDMDSSFEARQELAAELRFEDYKGSAEDNGKLYKHLMEDLKRKCIQIPT